MIGILKNVPALNFELQKTGGEGAFVPDAEVGVLFADTIRLRASVLDDALENTPPASRVSASASPFSVSCVTPMVVPL
jgi:hypothetical protein